jgi:branched-chain amino acid transport system permease protein
MVVGGEGSFFGPIIGTTLFMLIFEFSRPLQSYRPLVYGGVLILIVFFMPKGLIAIGEYLTTWYRKVVGRFRKKISSPEG